MSARQRRGRGRPRIERRIVVEPVRREEIDIRRLARALLAIVQAEAAREAQQEAHDEQP